MMNYNNYLKKNKKQNAEKQKYIILKIKMILLKSIIPKQT